MRSARVAVALPALLAPAAASASKVPLAHADSTSSSLMLLPPRKPILWTLPLVFVVLRLPTMVLAGSRRARPAPLMSLQLCPLLRWWKLALLSSWPLVGRLCVRWFRIRLRLMRSLTHPSLPIHQLSLKRQLCLIRRPLGWNRMLT